MDFTVWQPDTVVDTCFLCDTRYSLFYRRHHCRKCGRVVCAACSSKEVKYFPSTLVVHANSAPLRCHPTQTYRTCDKCVADIERILQTHINSASQEEGNWSTYSRLALGHDLSDQNSPGLVASVKDTIRVTSGNIDLASVLTSNRTDTESDHNICPVCAVDLLQLFVTSVQNGEATSSLNAFEVLKEAHINECLVMFDFTNDNMRLQSPPNASHARNRMLVYNIPPIPKPSYEIVGSHVPNSVETLLQEMSGLLVTNATMEPEKALLDNECVICLEDLKPGDKVGRLECLCVFHYKCIKDWFAKKRYRECPVHFLHR